TTRGCGGSGRPRDAVPARAPPPARPRVRDPPRSEFPTVHLDPFEGVQVHSLEATDVHRRHLAAVRHLAERECLGAAVLAEAMLDRVPVEGVGAQLVLALEQPEGRARHEPEQEALALTVRAVALHDLVDLSIDRVLHRTAMAASGLH